MSFVNMFDLVNFDDAGHIKPVYKEGKMVVSLAKAESNFLYLLTKYNRNFLLAKNIKLSDFFKKELGDILKEVENGGDYSIAYQKVLENCVAEIRDLSRLAMPTEKGLLILLNEMTPIVGATYDKMKFGQVKNTLEENYKLARLASTYESTIEKLVPDYIAGETNKIEDKQTIFNTLVNLNVAYARLVRNDEEHHEVSSRRASVSRQSSELEISVG